LLKDQTGKNQFYTKEDNAYTHLLYKQYAVKTETSSKVIAENNGYKGTLALYLKDCPGIQEKLRTATYTSSSLTKVFEYFYQCTNSSFDRKDERQEGKVEMGIVVGASLTQLDFSGPIRYLTKVEYNSSTNATFGLFFDLKLLRSKGWRISNDLLFTSFDVKGEGYFEDFPDFTAKSSFAYSHLKTLHALQVSLLGRGKVYIAGGFSTGFVIKKDTEIQISYETGTTGLRQFESRNFEFGYLAGLGFRAGNWNGEIRFEQTSGISNYLREGSTLMRGYFLIRFRILKP
jgi:hypothetical protein